LSAKGNGLIGIDKAGTVSVWQLDIPHPEVSFTTLFGKVWYEGYNEPAYVWQSSAANDDFEPKLSLTPLIFGTLKGTFYAMIFAVPLALLGAIYTSQFLNQRIKTFIKPSVEIMAAIPSVVIGFLGGLWLAPLLDKTIVGFFLSVLVIPAIIFILILFWQRLKPASRLDRAAYGHEFLVLIPAVLLGGAIAFYLGGVAEATFFGSDFKLWLFKTFGIRADQRNSMVISLALGFAVIPIIFTIAEDALSNVPKSLSAASLALGASRWQTAWRVVLPSAVPGIFSAIMIGFGRAVGETMIVLMATGNTPIINLSMFNGFRSLSANIAVEIPEAPFAGTLYRVLFLSAVLLFAFTFIVNTAAEILRQRFRKKYGRY
jgi:phosphate transport system permease protein